MSLDRAGTQEQLRTHFPGGGARGHLPRDLQFLGRELTGRWRRATTGVLTGRPELFRRSRGEGVRADAREEVMRYPQLFSGFLAAPRSTQPFPVDEVSPRRFAGQSRGLEILDRGAIVRLSRLARERQRTRTRLQAASPRGVARLRAGAQL